MTREKAWVYQSTKLCLPCMAELMTVLCVHLVVDQPPNGAGGVYRQGRRHGPTITYKTTPCWVTLLQPAGRAAVLGQPSSLRRHQGMTTLCQSPLYPPVRDQEFGYSTQRSGAQVNLSSRGPIVECQKTAFWRDPVLQFRNSYESFSMQEGFKFPGFYFFSCF